ncbi:MAG: hypothetical protein IT582_04625 [Opitutaceae bacterium]|nr:hypothetical protein [Opitutaceae bacterium]
MRHIKEYFIALLALTTLAACYQAWSQARELATLRDALAAAAKPGALPSQSASQVVASISLPDMEPPPVSPDHAVAKPLVARADETRGADRQTRQRSLEAFRAIANSPEYQRLRAIEQKGRLDQEYAALFKKMRLTPDQLDQFKNLLVEKQRALADVVAAVREQGIDPRANPADFRQIVDSEREDINDSIRQLLGDAGFEAYQNYERTEPFRNVVTQLGTRLSYGSSPLTDTQGEQLVQVLADANQRAVRPGQTTPTGQPTANVAHRRNALNDEAMVRAQSILSPDQYAALQDLQRQQQARAALGNLFRQQAHNGSAQAGPDAAPAGAIPAIELPR